MPRVLLAFEPPDGGVPENVAQLALGLSAHGWEAEVAGPLEASPYPRLEAAGVAVHRLSLTRSYTRPGADVDALRAVSRLLRRGDFDLIHSHASHAGVLGRLAALASGTASLYSPHCFAFASGLPLRWRVAATAVERALGRAGGSVLCVSEYERQVALRARVARPERLYVVHNGCEAPPEAIEPDATLSALRARGPVAGAVAALRTQKHLDLLIDATPLVLARAPTATVAIVGNGPLQAQLEEHAAGIGLEGDERFMMLPFVAPAARALKALDVYVLPSAWESFSIGVLEALACGVPQLVTDVGGNSEAVTPQTGVIVPPDDPAALADALVALLNDPSRRDEAARASRLRHAERFTVERMLTATAGVYDAVLASSQVEFARRRSG